MAMEFCVTPQRNHGVTNQGLQLRVVPKAGGVAMQSSSIAVVVVVDRHMPSINLRLALEEMVAVNALAVVGDGEPQQRLVISLCDLEKDKEMKCKISIIFHKIGSNGMLIMYHSLISR